MKNSLKIENLEFEIKSFISAFDFWEPDWDKLPAGFPNLSRKGLTREESYLLDGIILAWRATQKEGMKRLFTDNTKTAGFTLVLVIGLISLIGLISQPPEEFTKTVNAATLQVDEMIQSTMSAILRR